MIWLPNGTGEAKWSINGAFMEHKWSLFGSIKNDNILTTFLTKMTTFWQRFDNILTTFLELFENDNVLTTFWQRFDNIFWKILERKWADFELILSSNLSHWDCSITFYWQHLSLQPTTYHSKFLTSIPDNFYTLPWPNSYISPISNKHT